MQNDLSVIDFHSHYVDPSWSLPAGSDPAQRALWDRIIGQMSSEAVLVADIESGDLDGRVVNTPAALFTEPDAPVPLDTVRHINDQLGSLVARHAGRIHGLAAVDGYDGDISAREVVRAVREKGLRGVFLDSARGEQLVDASAVRPTLAAAADLGVPVFVHPVNPQPLSRQMAPYGQVGVLLARGTVNAATLVALLEGGVFDELPGLRVVVTTLALGAIILAGGLAAGAGLRTDAPALLRRHVYVDTMGFHPALIRASAEILGAGHVLAGTDWLIVNEQPIKDTLQRALTAADLTSKQQKAVASGNALSLLSGAS